MKFETIKRMATNIIFRIILDRIKSVGDLIYDIDLDNYNNNSSSLFEAFNSII